ncbi:MAG TPA: DNA ligase D, partial [Conexibacter sp.]|nr:DNA ligase D [Conexibacter sp.]
MPRTLAEYRQKRRFEETPEPSGGGAARGPDASAAPGGRFVVHEHHARRLHWDLRLERDGVLVSWAIPNGIPEDPRHNRKAVHVEDHPLDYIDFRGTIPQGSYGAGEVKVWDSGTYTAEKWEPRKVVVAFDGERLQGRYALFHAGRAEKDWMIHRMDPPADPGAAEMPDFVEPMLARLSTMPPDEARWGFEVKWDGVRALARSEPGRIRLITRNGNDVTAAYPELRGLNRALGSHAAMLDGEIVAFDEQGRPSFQALQPRIHLRGETAVRRRAAEAPVTYVIFDLLWLDGHPLTDLPYKERRERLAALELDGERWRAPAHHEGAGSALLAATGKQSLEGVLAKRLDSRYTPGRRDGSWLKVKHSRRQELVIGGWTEGRRARAKRLGALELGVHHEDGTLRYAGRVGTGFDDAELERLAGLLKPLVRRRSPFTGRQPARGAHFVEPRLVCEVEFGEWTRDGRLRHPRYEGLRDDKPAAEVVRERMEPPPEREAAGSAALTTVATLVAAGRRVRGGVEVEIGGRTLKLTNLDKVLYPKAGFTKRDVIEYYTAIAPAILAHLESRPLTRVRFPNGVEDKSFFEKQCPSHRPEWVAVAPVPLSEKVVEFCVCDDLPTLVWLGNLAALELHTSLSRAVPIERPTAMVFDLDPGEPADIVDCCQVGVWIRGMLRELGLETLAKVSGSGGLHVYAPLNSGATYGR